MSDDPTVKSVNNLTDDELLEVGRGVLLEESEAIRRTAAKIGGELVTAARMITDCGGRVVVSGLGKSGLVGRKIAATFASLGIPAFFLHAAEGAHGDLGMVCADDVGLFISNSGETAELVGLLPYFRRIGAAVISMTGRRESTLAKNSDVALILDVEREADPLGLAPTSSTSVQMATGDAIAGISARIRGLGVEDFAVYHPGGTLGRKLLLTVGDIMATGEALPTTPLGSLVREALFEITSKGYGTTVIVDKFGELAGILTDGDLRRLLERRGTWALDLGVESGMTKNPKTITGEKLASEAMRIMESAEISVLIVVDGSVPIGILHIHDLLKAGL